MSGSGSTPADAGGLRRVIRLPHATAMVVGTIIGASIFVQPSEVTSVHLKRFFYDTVNFDPGALRLAIEFAGAGQILAGSDYLHQIGSIPRMLSSIRSLGLPKADEARILGGNAAGLVGG